ncbi:MAG: dTMP kinase [Candidatus Pelagibacter sp.]
MYNKVIVFEGIDGSGKTYHLNAASNYLKKKKINHIRLREPGGSKNSEKLRKLLLSNKSNFEKKTDLLIYLSARSENFHKIIKPNLKNKVILIDRFVDSTIAYQHYGFGINKNIINLLNKFILGSFKVDFTFLHIVQTKHVRKKIKAKKNRYDKFNKDFYLKVQNGFLKLSSKKKNYLKIHSNETKDRNKQIIQKKLNSLIKIK